MSDIQKKLMDDIRGLILEEDTEGQLTPEIREYMATSLLIFVRNSVSKFLKGQQQHGGDIRDRDLLREMSQEHIDMFWYKEAMIWPKKK